MYYDDSNNPYGLRPSAGPMGGPGAGPVYMPIEEHIQAHLGGGMSYGQKMNVVRRPKKQEIINWFREYMGTNELDLVDDSYDQYARHVCMGGNQVELLPKNTFRYNIDGCNYIELEYYRCNKCGKVILNRNFM